MIPVRISDHVPSAPEKQLEEVPLYDDARVLAGNALQLSESMVGMKFLRLFVTYTQVGVGDLSAMVDVDVDYLLNTSDAYAQLLTRTSAGSFVEAYIQLSNTTDTQLGVAGATDNSVFANVGIHKVVGYRNRYTTETKQVTIPVNNGNNVTVNARYEIPASQLPSDFLNADGTIKSSVKCIAEIFNNSGTGVEVWGETGSYTDFTSQVFASFVKAGKADNSIAVQTGATSLCERSQYGGSAFGNTNLINAAPCRLIVWNDEKTAISVPVGDKGYGGLRKDTVDIAALADFTVPNVIDFNLPLVSAPLKVTQNVSNNRLSLSQIGIWGSSGSINLTFDSSNNGREIIADIYNETKGQVALEKPEYVARNQLGITIPISVDVLEILTSGDEYSLRVRSNDVFTNVKVGKCWWDVTLNAPL
ncbi:hypothetical protein [Vibrio diazotrophicus]|uniref:hypothetical protein n=1 Tax=Vibrio diazotrophicus TaxID=685 RepID=UPI003D2F846D